MSEIINTYRLDNPGKVIPMSRASFYDEEISRSNRWLPPVKYIEVVHIFLFNEHGELIVQKRSKEKQHNPNLLDKSIGGHVQNGDNPNLTAMIETIQELQTPSIVLNTESDFARTYSVLQEYITTSVILQYIDTLDILSRKVIDGKVVSIGNRVHTYFGIYAWRVKNVDKEAKGILYYSLDDIREEISVQPEIFTHDLQVALVRYDERIKNFLLKLWLR